jgi:hypothetical protein
MSVEIAFPATPASADWLRLQSAALTRLVALELLTQPSLPLSPEVRMVLEDASKSDDKTGIPPVLERMGLWVDLTPLKVYAQYVDDRTWHNAALAYCIRRQAHYPLLKRLFPDSSRADIQKLREELKAPLVCVHRQAIPEPDSICIWQAWQDIQKQFDREIEQWVQLAERFPEYPLNALYQFLVIAAQ